MKVKLAISLLAASLLMVHGMAFAGIVDPCNSTAVLSGTGGAVAPFPLFICPLGDTDTYDDQEAGPASGIGFIFTLVVRDAANAPIANIPASDFWVVDCDNVNDIILCGGAASTTADQNTDAGGNTTIGNFGSTAGGGCALGLSIVVQGAVLLDPASGCTTDLCFTDIQITSPDLTGDNIVALADLSLFATYYPGGASGYNVCADFDLSGTPVALADLSRFAFHYGDGTTTNHTCN